MLDNDQTFINESHNNICSTAQDIIYLASRKKKLTPKHVGLCLTLKETTRSEKLVNMLHASRHTIGMDTIRLIDTTIVSDLLDRYVKNDNAYIPNEIAPYSRGRITLMYWKKLLIEGINFTVLKRCCGNKDQRMKDQMKNTESWQSANLESRQADSHSQTYNAFFQKEDQA